MTWRRNGNPQQRRSSLRRSDAFLFVAAFVLAAAAVFHAIERLPTYFSASSATAGRSSAANASPSTDLTVVDGDTVRSGGTTYRLVGFNTPESGDQARCDSERRLAAAATARLQDLVASGSASLERVACACRPGTEGTNKCNFGRLCGRLKVNGRDAGSILIGEGLAESYVCSGTSCPRRRNWCT